MLRIMRWVAIAFLVLLSAVLVACDPGIGLTMVNNADIPVCFYSSGNYEDGKDRPDTTDPGEVCATVEPPTSNTWAVLCYDDSTKWVVLTLGAGGREIYAQSATCGEWKKAGARVVIDQRDGQFVVEDNLPDSPQ